jgi:hypothetical protein
MQSGKIFNSFIKKILTICKKIVKWFLVLLPNHTYFLFLSFRCNPFV